MLGGGQNDIETLVVRQVHTRPYVVVDLIETIKKIRPKTTKQAVYAAIRKLRKEEVIVKHKKQISLSKVWIQKMSEFFSVARHSYLKEALPDNSFLQLSDGDRVSYNFQSPYVTDQYWGHIFSILTDMMDKKVPIMLYNPHQWFMVARQETEMPLFEAFSQQHLIVCMSVGGNTVLDKVIQKKLSNEYIKYSTNIDLELKPNHYINIFGDYIIDVYLDPVVSENIATFYSNTKETTTEAIKALQDIVSKKGRNRLVVSRNAKRAQKLRKKMAKNFFIPEPQRSHI